MGAERERGGGEGARESDDGLKEVSVYAGKRGQGGGALCPSGG